jgi:dimeric dUTPase (all-alpha-NTP-PPase superfamily)
LIEKYQGVKQMNLSKLFELQRQLDERIIREKGLEGQDLTLNTVTALIVELGEFANEARWFKHWSNDQDPRTYVQAGCEECVGGLTYCEKCIRNPLLEEYADCLSFFLSLANSKGWNELLYLNEEGLHELKVQGFNAGLSGVFLEMIYHLTNAFMRRGNGERIVGWTFTQYSFRSAWFLFIAIGTIGFNFTFEQIEEAYLRKNAVNHQRQESGY